MLDFQNVSCAYPGGESVLHGMSFHIAEGEQVGLIGANGAGKSTLIKAALGLIGAEGRITAGGLPVNGKNLAEIRRTLGCVLQDSDDQMFMPTVLEDMLFGPMNYGASRREAERLADEALASLGAEHLKHRRNHGISGGEKKLAAIATVLAMHPRVMLIDEPTAGLDPRNRRALINVLGALPVTKLIATHDLDLVLELCDRVILLHEGSVAADGPAEEILRDRPLLEANGLELPFCLAGPPERRRERRET